MHMWGKEVYGSFLPSSQFYCEPKTIRKKSSVCTYVGVCVYMYMMYNFKFKHIVSTIKKKATEKPHSVFL